MVSGATDVDAAAVLAAARGFRRDANAAEAGVLAKAVEWAHLHVVEDLADAATVWAGRGQDTGIPIAGEGAPLVSEFAVAEFAAALGLSAESGRHLIAQALELAHRLPRLWARVCEGSLAPWRARRIAEETLLLAPEAADFVDAQLAPFAHRTGPAQTQRLLDEAIARFMPEYAAEARDRAAEQRYFTIDHDQVSFAGTSRVHGELDLADALDLEDALRRGADQLKALGNPETLDVRRSLAVGMLARGEQALELEPEGSTTAVATGSASRRASASRQVVLYVHLSEAALRTHDTDAPAHLENAGGQLLTAGQVAAWCGRADTTRIVVKPVRDLTALHHPTQHPTQHPSAHPPRRSPRLGASACPGATTATDPYRVPAQMAEDVELRDRTCVFPWCHRPARRCDKDHIVPHDQGGPTCPCNLAPLCRLHHRIKTHGGWTYTTVEPGMFLWRSPHGHTWLRDHTGTTDLTPPPVEPPGHPDR
jgi:hypothetical protein